MCQAEIPRQGILLPWQLAATLLGTESCSGDAWLDRDVRFVVESVPEIEVGALVTAGFALTIQT